MRELKAERIREMTEDEIVTRVRELHEEIFNLRFRNSMRQLQNPLLIRERKRDIARLTTILVEHRSGIRKLAGHSGAMSGAGTAPKAAVKESKAEKPAKEAKPAKAAKAPKAEKETKAAKSKATKESKK